MYYMSCLVLYQIPPTKQKLFGTYTRQLFYCLSKEGKERLYTFKLCYDSVGFIFQKKYGN